MEKEQTITKETEEEVARLKKLARKTNNVKLRQRYDIIRLFLCKRTKPDIAAILDISLTQVYLILNLYEQGGIEGLELKHPTGRQRKLTDEQEQELCSVITEKLPKDVGLEPFCNWTAPLACKYVKDHYGVTFSERGMRDVFYRLKLSYTRPTYVLAKADPQKQAEFLERLEGIKKHPSCLARLKKLARKTNNVKLRQRYDIIRLFLCKRTKPDIAAILDISLTQVYLILNENLNPPAMLGRQEEAGVGVRK